MNELNETKVERLWQDSVNANLFEHVRELICLKFRVLRRPQK